MLEALATNLAMLEHLHIVGCPKVTHKGVWYLVSANKGLIGLGLENLAQTFVCFRSNSCLGCYFTNYASGYV
jgi:hypothetical protein